MTNQLCACNQSPESLSSESSSPAHTIKVVPRVISELGAQHLTLLLSRPGPAIARLVEECSKHGYDGLVSAASLLATKCISIRFSGVHSLGWWTVVLQRPGVKNCLKYVRFTCAGV